MTKTIIGIFLFISSLTAYAKTTDSISGRVINHTNLDTSQLKVNVHWSCSQWGGILNKGVISSVINEDGTYYVPSQEVGLCPRMFYDFNQNYSVSYNNETLLSSGIKSEQVIRIIKLNQKTQVLPYPFYNKKVQVLIYQQHEPDKMNSYPDSTLLRNYSLNVNGDSFTFPQTYLAIPIKSLEEMNRVTLKLMLNDKLNHPLLVSNERMDTEYYEVDIDTLINFIKQ